MKEQAKRIYDAWEEEFIKENNPHYEHTAVAAVLRTAALYCKRDALILLSLAEELENLND